MSDIPRDQVEDPVVKESGSKDQARNRGVNALELAVLGSLGFVGTLSYLEANDNSRARAVEAEVRPADAQTEDSTTVSYNGNEVLVDTSAMYGTEDPDVVKVTVMNGNYVLAER